MHVRLGLAWYFCLSGRKELGLKVNISVAHISWMNAKDRNLDFIVFREDVQIVGSLLSNECLFSQCPNVGKKQARDLPSLPSHGKIQEW